jgi:hypothetical protein
MDNQKTLELLITTLRARLSEAVFRAAELETLLILEQEKTAELLTKIDVSDALDK